MLFRGREGRLPEDDIHTEALTLVKMDGSHKTISYDPYPVRHEPSEKELFRAFGDFSDANIFVVNTKSKYRPFTIGRTKGVSLSPYAPERPTRRGTFQSWPQNPDRDEGYDGAALGHIVLRTFFRRTEKTISQVYLSGFTNAGKPHEEVVPLARSWLSPPAIHATGTDGKIRECTYDMAQRAYLVENAKLSSSRSLVLKLDASEAKPAVNPAFLIQNAGYKRAMVRVKGTGSSRGSVCRVGHYDALQFDGSRTWKDVLAVWIGRKSNEPIVIEIKGSW
jgi:hypothetical protein